MQEKLQLTTVINRILLLANFSKSNLDVSNFSRENHIGKKVFLPLLFLLAYISSYGQLATQNFESGIPANWTIFNNNVGTLPWTISNDGYLGSDAAFIDPSAENIGAGNTAQYFLVTPLVQVPVNGEIRFYTKRLTDDANPGIKYQIRLSTASQPDINGFSVVLQEWDGASLNTGADNLYEEKIVSLPSTIPPGLEIYIAFVAVNTQTGAVASGDAWFIDNVRIIESCLKVVEANFTVENITPTTADLSWTHPEATNFQIQVVPQGEIPATSGITVANSYEAENLDGDSFYDVYIRTICDAETASAWAGPFSFKTAIYGLSCETPIVITASSGVSYSLDANLKDFPNADTVIYANQGTSCLSPAITENYLEGNKIFLSYTPTQTGVINISQMTLPWTSGTECWGNAITGVFVYDSCTNVGVECLAGLNTTQTDQPKYIENFPVVAGIEYVIVISTSFAGLDTSICFEFDLSFSTCPAPSVFTYKDLVQDSVSFSWNNPVNIADSWEYAVQTAGSGIPTAGTPTNTNVDNVINTGLSAGNAYELYVRSVCDGTPGEWSMPYAFTTQCAIFDTPYTTDFVDTSAQNPEPCWTSMDLNADGVKWSYQAGWEEGYLGYATLNTNTNQNNNHDYLVSPQINFNGTQKRLRYSHQVGWGGSSSYSIKISTTGIGAENFTYTLLPETVISNEAWQEVIYNIPETITGTVNIAWIVSPLGSGQEASRISITNVFIEDKPACPDPIAPIAENVTTTTAELSWTIGESETQWQVAIQPLNTGLPTGDGILVDSNPYIATVEPATRYEYYVRAYCNDVEQSNWVGPYYFTTQCISFDTPFYEGFNDADADTKKFCWSINNANEDGATWMMNPQYPSIQPSTSWFNPTTEFNDYLISPAINAVGTKALKFDYRAAFSIFAPTSRFGVEVLISTTDTNPESFTVLGPLMEFTNTDFLQKTLYFEGTGITYIAFRVPPAYDLAGGSSILQIDNVIIEDAPPCPKPSDLSATSIMQNQALLSWTAGYQEEAWNVVVQEAGLGTPTVSGTPVTANNYTPNTLDPNTVYEFYVRANCTGENSEWVGPFVFRTLCTAFNTPFLETFNTDSTSEDCWRILNENSDGNIWSLQVTVNPYEGDQMAGMFTGSNGANDDWLISPTINVTANQRLRFYYKVYHSDFTEDLRIHLSTTGIDVADFTTTLYDSEVETVLINNIEYKEMIINLPEGITGNINIGWHIPEMEPSWMGYRGQLLFIDNVIIEDIPPCASISNPIVANITDTTFQVAWEANGTETSWELSVQPYGTPAPTGATLPEYLYTATTNPFTVTNLDPATKYEVYVRAICNETLQSEWVGPIEVITKCSFENLCQYTITLSGGPTSGIGGGIDVIQNGYVIQTLDFPSVAWNEIPEPLDFTLFLCTGVEFSLFWDSIGTAPGQFPGATVTVKNTAGEVVSTTDLGLLPAPRSTFFTGIATCGTIVCPQPTNLASSPTTAFTWTPGGTETQWEVFVQPVGNNTLPQSGTIVNTPTYTPTEADFNDATTTTYEYFVRAICGEDNKSFWSGPKVFVRNDDASTALKLAVNGDETCSVSASDVTFNGASASTDPLTCAGTNNGDIWFEFDATAKIHIIEANGFTGNFYISSGDEPYPDMTMTLYQVTEDGLVEKACSNNNSIVAMYTSELVVGGTYKIRLMLNAPTTNTRKFNVCIKTPLDFCKVNAVNYDFETPPMQHVTGITTIGTEFVVPGWRVNLDTWDAIFFSEALTAINFAPYSGGQCIQLLSDPEEDWDANDPNIKGIYQEFDTSEITVMNYSFAHATRSEGNSIQLYAGPPTGPFTLVTEEAAVGLQWTLKTGEYVVPAGQTKTRFIFRTKENKIGSLLDVANFTPNIDIKTVPQTLACQETEVVLEAEGIGTWSADEANPATTLIANATTKTATISGFNTPGVYTYHWITRYCDRTVTVTYEGISDVPTVITPVEYCLNATAQPLTATPSENHTLKWFTDEIGGTGTTTAPTPATNVLGTTIYYVANVNAEGCEGPRVALSVIINDTEMPEVGFAYDAPQYCAIGTNPVITLNDGFATGGTFTVLPTTGLSIDATTGAIDLSTSTAGTYEVTYSVLQNECTLADDSSVTIIINSAVAPVVGFTYPTPVCTNNANLTPTLVTNFTSGGTFSSTTLTVDATTGEIDMATTTAGTHDVVYTIASSVADCQLADSEMFQVVIEALVTPVTGFTFNPSYCLADNNPLPTLPADFYTGGSFSSSTGLIIDASTGEIDLENSPAGVHSVTYDVPSNGCVDAGTTTVSVTMNALATPTVSFSYEDACVNATTSPLPVLATGFTQGGTFSSTTLTVNPTTGAVDLTSATEGTHDIVYTLNEDVATCTDGAVFSAEINLIDGINAVTSFTYDATYCSGSTTDLPTLATDFTLGGTFTSTNGLVINATTGAIDIQASEAGVYVITYEVESDEDTCTVGDSDTFTITIFGDLSVAVNGGCDNSQYLLIATPVDGSFNPSNVDYTWKDASGAVVGTNSDTFNVTEYANGNSNAVFPITFTVTVDAGDCSIETPYTVNSIGCREIPRGISPNGDEFNQNFDLTDLNVRNIIIFNRYGTEVFSFKGNYTNQWFGQSSGGKELPVGTYFYSITTENGASFTGWVYINR
ncbi:gliding motility-associated-like protein [Flavobacterium arsenatis]|uniref:Gliding motility-associated-like protein n=1 Tax=Flavobacterium arsenatis TaxID=1484332 RepID=A0ABU1TMR0_9FLAO|nr:choice-of-anchor J domain-containing protein [Flavobacterium arsenatis]MDR6967264.1 gliding motility-associated-like protein [Flavobacterium arsenatis]